MKEFEFQYTKMWDTLSVMLLSMAVFIIAEIIGIEDKLDFILTILVAGALAVLRFQFLKRKVVRFCTATQSQSAVIFAFKNETKTINFSELTSYKYYKDKNGPILYLNSSVEKFKLFSNNNFRKTTDFELFTDAIMSELDAYKNRYNPTLIHKGSVFATKGFLYFLYATTIVYFVSFAILKKDVRIVTGISGAIWLLIMWGVYFSNRDLKSK